MLKSVIRWLAENTNLCHPILFYQALQALKHLWGAKQTRPPEASLSVWNDPSASSVGQTFTKHSLLTLPWGPGLSHRPSANSHPPISACCKLFILKYLKSVEKFKEWYNQYLYKLHSLTVNVSLPLWILSTSQVTLPIPQWWCWSLPGGQLSAGDPALCPTFARVLAQLSGPCVW